MTYLCRTVLLLALAGLALLPSQAIGAGKAEISTTELKAADLVADGQPIDLTSPRYVELFQELRERHGFSQEELLRLFAGVTIRKKVLELMDTQWEAKPYYLYWPLFITPQVVEEGRRLREQHSALLDTVEKQFGVERDIVLAIWGIESRFGKSAGTYNLFQTLNTMYDAYPRRRDFYRAELLAFLLLCRESGVPPLSVNGSYGGAFGQTQFMPSSFQAYAVDLDGDHKRDVWQSVPDVLASIANYLHEHGWVLGAPVYRELGEELKGELLTAAYRKGRKGLVPWQQVAATQGVALPPSPGDRDLTIVGLELADGGLRYVAAYPNFQAITKWNNSNRYAMAVTELAERLRGK